MAGKRLIDAAKLLNAGTSVAKQHLLRRRLQWDVYNRTSSLAKIVKGQTERVTVTAQAFVQLAKRLNDSGPSWEEEGSKTTGAGSQNKIATVQDAHATKDDLENWIRPGHLSTSERRRTSDAGRLSKTDTTNEQVEHLPAGDQNAFNKQQGTHCSELSSGIQSQLPEPVLQTSRVEKASPLPSLNQDVYSGPSRISKDVIPDGVDINIFSTHRVSQTLGQKTPALKNPYTNKQRLPPQPLPEMKEAHERWQRQRAEDASASIRNKDQTITRNVIPMTSKETESNSNASLGMHTPDPINTMRESRVPSSRIGRLWQYGGLASSLAVGAFGESIRRITGSQGTGSVMLSEANMNRLVAKLSRMRGAALKLGQMMSFQDSKLLPPTINAVLQRVQDSADYMPSSQRDRVLVKNLGEGWRELFSEFHEKPFAAASIGQVHKARLTSNGKEVAVKVQYPGVRNSIDSDLNNLSLLLTASKLLPKGLFLEKTIANARVELGWECDYEREAAACIRFREILQDEVDTFTVPEVYPAASGPGVLTTEFMKGTAVAKIKDLTQSERDWIGTQILRLCLRELMEWRFMQTDPNWTNFLYNRHSGRIELLDFGASREFPAEFVEPYVSLLIAASRGERDRCRELSIQLGYLTGHESRAMVNAHVESILTLAEPFVVTAPDIYDFEDQTITDRVRANIGLMLRERLAPPPEETYSLHRKLSGAFLLCARLRSKVKARHMFENAIKAWAGRTSKASTPM